MVVMPDTDLDSAPGEGATIVVDGRTAAQGMDGFLLTQALLATSRQECRFMTKLSSWSTPITMPTA